MHIVRLLLQTTFGQTTCGHTIAATVVVVIFVRNGRAFVLNVVFVYEIVY